MPEAKTQHAAAAAAASCMMQLQHIHADVPLTPPAHAQHHACPAGSPLSIHPNITRARGRTGAARGWALMTPALAAAAGEAAGPGGAMLGCFTLVKKGGAATGAAAATGRAGRSRAATGAGRGAGAAAAQGAAAAEAAAEDTAMVITTEGELLHRTLAVCCKRTCRPLAA